MRKSFFALCAAMLAFAACKQDAPVVAPELKLTTESAVTVPMDGDIVTVEFTSSVAWTAALDVEKDVASVNVKSGTKDEGKVKVTVMALKEDNATRSFTLTLTPEGGEPVKVTFTQNGPYVPFFEVSETSFAFGSEGGTQSFTISTNVEYEVENNTDFASLSINSETAEVTVPANEDVMGRSGNIVFAIPSITETVDGEPVAKTVVISIMQEGQVKVVYTQDMPEALPADGVYSVAVADDFLLVGDGKTIHAFNKGTGEFVQTMDLGVNVISITSDDAGNICIATGSGAYSEDFAVMVAPAESLLSQDTYKTVISCKNQFYGYGYFGIKVTGNALKGEAALCLISGAGGSGAYGVSWQLNDGACVDENYTKYTTLPVEGQAMWSSHACVCRHLSTNIEKGMLYVGYDKHQNLCYNPTMADDTWTKVCALGLDGNNGTLDMDLVEVNGHRYCFTVNMSYFSWSKSSISLINIDNLEESTLIATIGINEDREFGSATNAAICAEVEGSKCVLYVVDQSFRAITKIQFNSL